MQRTLERNVREQRSNMQTLWDYGVLPRGDEGVRRTIRLMAEYANKDSKSEVIGQITRAFSRGTTDREKVFAAFNWIVSHIRYTGDGFDEYVRSPRHVVTTDFEGDCDDLATLFASMMLSMGYEVWFKVIAWREANRPENPFTHVYNLVLLPHENVVIPVDCVMSKYGFQNEKKPTFREAVYTLN